MLAIDAFTSNAVQWSVNIPQKIYGLFKATVT